MHYCHWMCGPLASEHRWVHRLLGVPVYGVRLSAHSNLKKTWKTSKWNENLPLALFLSWSLLKYHLPVRSFNDLIQCDERGLKTGQLDQQGNGFSWKNGQQYGTAISNLTLIHGGGPEQHYFLKPRDRDLYRVQALLARQGFFAASYRTVHFLSSIFTWCIPCWSSCRGIKFTQVETDLRRP